MKTLYLLRHAHSESAEPGQDDHDRALSARGEQEADNVGAFMKEQGFVPDALFCSTSNRTKETVRLSFARIFKPGRDGIMYRYDRGFYLAPMDVLMDEIREADDHFKKLLVVGHNPGLEDLAEKLAGGGGAVGKFPPSALAVFHCDINEWRDFSPKTCKLKTLFMP